jgi:hypothetical protein
LKEIGDRFKSKSSVIQNTKKEIKQRYNLKIGEGPVTFCGPKEAICLQGNKLKRVDLRHGVTVKDVSFMKSGEVSCLQSCSDNGSLFLIGYKNGLCELRDTYDLQHIYWEHTFTGTGVQSPIHSFIFRMENFANIVVLQDNGTVHNAILKRIGEKLHMHKLNTEKGLPIRQGK